MYARAWSVGLRRSSLFNGQAGHGWPSFAQQCTRCTSLAARSVPACLFVCCYATEVCTLQLLDYVAGWSDRDVPSTSLLREFIGNGAFDEH